MSSDCCSTSTSTCSTPICSSSSADVTITEFQTQVVDPNNPQIVVTTTTDTSFDKCSVSGSCPSCGSSSNKCKSSSSSSKCKSSSSSDKCKSSSDKCKSSSKAKGISCFKFWAIISNTINLQPNPVEFIMRRVNNTVTLQWKQFSGIINANGIPFVTAVQSVPSLPPYAIDRPIGMLFNGRGQVGLAEITSDFDQVRFYFSIDKSGANIQQGDSFTIYGSNISWITS